MRLKAVINGGGRVGRFVIDYRDAIVPHTGLCEMFERVGAVKPPQTSRFYSFVSSLRRPSRVAEIGPNAVWARNAWSRYYGCTAIAGVQDATLAADEVAYLVFPEEPASTRWMWRRVGRDHGHTLFDVIIDSTPGGQTNFLVESWHMLFPIAGMYVVEDVTNLDDWRELLATHKHMSGVAVDTDDSLMLILERTAST